MIVRSSVRENYTIVCNKALSDERLSFEAKGMLCYLLSKPDSWRVKLSDLMSAGSCGRDKVMRMLRCLRECGYTSVRFSRDPVGKIMVKELVIHEEPYDGKPISRETQLMANPSYGKHDPIVITKKAVNTKKEVSTDSSEPKPTAPPLACVFDEVIESIPTNTGEGFQIRESLVHEWERLYPQVDVVQTLREIRAWNIANPKRRKTKSGVLKHVNAWLAKEQNRG